MRTIFTSLLLVLLPASFLFAQQPESKKISNMVGQLSKMKEDTNKVNQLNHLSQYAGWDIGNYDTALFYARNAERLSIKLNYKRGLASSYNNFGVVYFYQDNYPKALFYYSQSLKINEALGNQSGQASNFGNMGIIYKEQGNYDKALFFLFKALSIRKETGNKKEQAANLTNIGIVYKIQGNYPKALHYWLEALKINKEIGDQYGQGAGFINIGLIYKNQGDYPDALNNYFKSLKIFETLGDKSGQAANLSNIASVYQRQGNSSKALTYYSRALEMDKQAGDKKGQMADLNNIGLVYEHNGQYIKALFYFSEALKVITGLPFEQGRAVCFMNIGKTYRNLRQYTKAESYLKQAETLSRDIGAVVPLRDVSEELSKLYEKTHRPELALKYYKDYVVYRDSILNVEAVRKVTTTRLNYQFQEERAAAKIQQEKKMAKTRLYYGIGIFVMFLGAVVGFFLFFLSKMKRKKIAAEKKVLSLEKLKADTALSFAQKEMAQFVKNISEKNALIDKIREELETANGLSGQQVGGLDDRLAGLRGMPILTDDDWMSFLENFDTLYPRFSIGVKEFCPKITASELRYLMLSKIGLEHKQMANTLGVSSDAVRVTWNRVRKKLGGSLEDTPHTLLRRFEGV